VVEVGRHDELMARPRGVYARLHEMQLLEGRPKPGAAGQESQATR
jgi:hypothetical protein